MRLIVNCTTLILILFIGSACRKPVVGCMDPEYDNYDPEANEDNGCCCTIERGPDDLTSLYKRVTLPFPNVPNTASQVPSFDFGALASRYDQTAKGPCGCLEYWDWVYGVYLQPGGYSSSEDTYGPRYVCSTSLQWSGRSSTTYMDTAHWNIIAEANSIEAGIPSILIQFTVDFSGTGATEMTFPITDTLHAVTLNQPDPAVISLFWTSSGTDDYPVPINFYISGDDMPCSEYPLDSASMILDVLSIEFLQ